MIFFFVKYSTYYLYICEREDVFESYSDLKLLTGSYIGGRIAKEQGVDLSR